MAEIVRKKITEAAIIIIAALLAVLPSAMAIMAEMSIEDLTGQADVIVTGQVKEVESRRGADTSMIYTYTKLAVDRYIKGSAGGTLTIITEGGEVGEYMVWVEDMPEFSKNETVLVFLKRDGNDYTVAGLIQGKYSIEKGEVVEISGNKTSMDEFIRRIEAAKLLPTAVAPTETQAAPGFEMFFGVIGVLAVWLKTEIAYVHEILLRKRLFIAVSVLLTLGFALSLAGCIEQKESPRTTIPDIIIGVDSYNPPAYRGNSTLVNLVISGINVTKGTEISLNYKTRIWHTDGSWEENPESVHLTPEQKPLVFRRTVRAEEPEKMLSNLTINVDKKAVDGEYYITISGKNKDMAFGSTVLSFKIGKGGKLPLPEKNVWNIGYAIPSSLSEKERAAGSSSLIAGFAGVPPLSGEEKLWAIAIASNDTSLKGRSYEITGVSSGFYDSQNYSGFFPVVTVDIGKPDELGAIVSYIIDLEERKVFGSTGVPRHSAPWTMIRGRPAITAIQPDAGTIGTKLVITGTGFTAKDNNVAFRLYPEAGNNSFKVGYINYLKSYDGKTIEFVIPELLGACAFPLPETNPVTVCPAIGILFKPGTQTYPLFVVNQNGTSNSVNFTVSR